MLGRQLSPPRNIDQAEKRVSVLRFPKRIRPPVLVNVQMDTGHGARNVLQILGLGNIMFNPFIGLPQVSQRRTQLGGKCIPGAPLVATDKRKA
jgi:hypothetical protein